MSRLPKLFIFDLDGVITDTAEFHYLAWKQLAEELGITIDREFNETLKGVSRMDSLERILALKPSLKDMPLEEKERLAAKKNDHYLQFIQTITPEHVLPGIIKLLDNIKENNIQIALGSASKNAPMVLKYLHVTDYFDYVVDAAKVKRGKPDPETFTTAADHFGIPYAECIGLEDSQAGIEAINRAGMYSVGIGPESSLSEANYLVPRTEDLDFHKIIEEYKKSHVHS